MTSKLSVLKMLFFGAFVPYVSLKEHTQVGSVAIWLWLSAFWQI
jgi:hypothetical protein